MAGETPRAAKKPKRWADNRSADKYYQSADASALGTPTGRRDDAIPTPAQRAGDRSADKYYAVGGSDRVGAAGTKSGARQPAAPAAKPAVTSGLVRVDTDAQVRPALAAVADRVGRGEVVTVLVRPGEAAVLRRLRAGLDLMVTREEITEDQYRDVRLGYATDEAPAAPAAPAAKPTVSLDTPAAAIDPLAFLRGEVEDTCDPVVDTSAVTPTEVDPDDEGADFLRPR